jgi:uncharacterized YccA/Bax inhibitor family protein
MGGENMSNPVLNTAFAEQRQVLDSEPMTVNGAIGKTLGLLALAVLSAAYTWMLVLQGFTDKAQILMWVGLGGGLIAALAGIFTTAGAMKKGENPKAIVWLAPAYALFEGLALGGISVMYQGIYNGIVFQAILATFAVMLVMLVLFRANAIRATEKFRSVLLTATLSVFVIYLIQLIASFFGRGIPLIFDSGSIGIVFSLVVVAIASLNLIIDFDFIERAAQNLVPKNYEWYGAMGLMITLVWLYLEVLRLLAKLQDRR